MQISDLSLYKIVASFDFDILNLPILSPIFVLSPCWDLSINELHTDVRDIKIPL